MICSSKDSIRLLLLLLATLLHLVILIASGEMTRNGESTKPGMMKAAVLHYYGLPDALKIENVPIPTPAENQVLIIVKGVGVNPVDTYMRSGKHGIQPRLPTILGKEISGVIAEIHKDITVYKVGDRVFCGIEQGGYAQYAVANVTDCFPLSKKLSFSQGAALFTTYFTVYRGLVIKGYMQERSTVLIHGGSGSLGTAAVQIAKHMGAYVVVTVGSPMFKRLMIDAGADYVVYHDSSSEYYLINSIRKLKKPGFDIIFEIISNINIPRDRKYLNRNGKIIILGNRAAFRVNVNFNAPVKDKVVESVNFFLYTKDELNAAAEYILGGIECGCVRPYIAREYKLHEVGMAHAEVIHSRSSIGKVTLVL